LLKNDRDRPLECLTCDIKGADHSSSAAIENVGIDHGGFDIFVTEEFLDGADVVAVLEEVGCKAVAEGVATDAFEVGKKGFDFDASHFDGMAFVMEEDVLPNPEDVGFFGSIGVLLQP
jgi:hypothetical protein